MPPDLVSAIAHIEETNDPAKAFFSYTVDAAGEHGMIQANKEGLRLYAAEILRKSLELEAIQDGEPIYFTNHGWIVSDTGYDLICGILPEYRTREQILSSGTGTGTGVKAFPGRDAAARKGCMVSLVAAAIGGLILFAAHKAFPTLQLWANIH